MEGGWRGALGCTVVWSRMSGSPCSLWELQVLKFALELAVWVVPLLLRVSDGPVDGDGPVLVLSLDLPLACRRVGSDELGSLLQGPIPAAIQLRDAAFDDNVRETLELEFVLLHFRDDLGDHVRRAQVDEAVRGDIGFPSGALGDGVVRESLANVFSKACQSLWGNRRP